MRIHWTETALAHLDGIYESVARGSEDYARRIVDRLTRRSQQIGSFAQSCRRVPAYDMKQIREVIEGS
jgi:plasmid stabilization system protein ParE